MNERNLLLPAAIVVAGVIIGAAVLYVGGAKTPNVPTSGSEEGQNTSQPKEPVAADNPSLGDPNASVTLVEFADYQCSFCARFGEDAGKNIVEQYVKTGKVRMVYVNFPFLGEPSELAALASECALEQGKFWEYHDYLYAHQKAFTADDLKGFARSLGLDASSFASCLDEGRYLERVKADFSDGRARGVTGTPTFLISGELFDLSKLTAAAPYVAQGAIQELDPGGAYRISVTGALPFSVFQEILNAALGK